MRSLYRRGILLGGTATALAPAILRHARADQTPGVTDTEIKIGNTMPYSGPISANGTIGRVEAAYFRMINEQGGINGRKLNFISYDDAGSPPKTVEQTRRLVEEDGVAFLFNPLGSSNAAATYKYLNGKRVPHLFISSGADKWGFPAQHPWTIGWMPSFRVEARIYARYIKSTKPAGKIGIRYQNDDLGKDYVAGVRDGPGDASADVVAVSYELTDATINSQITTLRGAGVDALVTAATPKFAAMTIRKVSDLDWHPLHVLSFISTSVAAVMIPAGPEHGIGIVSSAYLKDPTDPAWAQDRGMLAWRDFMAQYYPGGDLKDQYNVYGYAVSQTMVQVLRACGDDLSRENIMKQATSLDHFESPALLPGITVNTSPTNYRPLRQLQMIRWNGKTWERFGDIIEGGDA